MAYEQKDNSGSLFQNNDKKTKPDANPKWPDLQGKAMIGGVMFYVSGWAKKKDDGEKWLSLSFKEVEKPPVAAPREQTIGAPDDEMPF